MPGESGRSGPVYNPATGEQTAAVDFASVEEVDRAVAAAKEAFASWRAVSLSRRAELFFRIRQLFDAHREDLARLLTAEHGKVLSDALGEVARGLEVIEFACGIPTLLKGELLRAGVDRASTSTRSASRSASSPGSRPFNFPAMVPMWMWAPAIACGNTFVLKPSEKDPSASILTAELLKEAGLPGRRLQRRPRRQGRGRRACSSTPTSPPSASSARRRSRATSTRPARGTASACRRSAGRRTT